MTGTVEAIFVTDKHGAAMRSIAEASLVAGCGISGDRNYRDRAASHEVTHEVAHDGQITLIAAEEVDRFNNATGLRIGTGDPRRNVVTRGVALNDLVGREFRVGAAKLVGVELCEPCATLGKRLASSTVSAAEVVVAFAHRAGLRARIIESARIASGDRVDI